MADFDPDAFLNDAPKKDVGAFDPDAFLAVPTEHTSDRDEAYTTGKVWDVPAGEESSPLSAIDAGVESIPGVKQIGAGMNALIDTAQGKGSLSDTYAKWMDMKRAKTATAQKDHPWLYGGTSAAANLGAAMATGPALVGLGTARGVSGALSSGLVDMGMAGAQAADEGDISGTGANALLGAGMGAAVNAVGKGIAKNAGSLMTGVQNTADDFAGWVGGSKIGRLLSSKGAKAPTSFESERVKALRQTVDAGDPDFGPASAKIMASAKGTLGEMADAPISELSEAQKLSVADQFASLLKERGAKDITSDKVLGNWDSIVARYTGGNGTAMDLLRGVNKRDAKWYASTGAGIEDTNRVLGLSGDVLPEVKDMFSGAQRTRQAAAEDRMNRFGQAKAPGEDAGAYQVDPSKIRKDAVNPDFITKDAPLAERLGKESAIGGKASLADNGFTADPKEFGDDFERLMRSETEKAVNTHVQPGSPWRNEEGLTTWLRNNAELKTKQGKPGVAQGLSDTADKIAKDARAGQDSALKDVLAQAREFEARVKAFPESERQINMAAIKQERARLAKLADEASTKLQRIGTGRSALENAAGAVSAVGGSGYGPMGVIAGAMAGKPIGKAIFKGIDMAGAAGQRLANVASVAERLATRDDAIGRAAQWALSAPGEKALARMMILADMPEVQQELDQEAQTQ